MVKVLNTPIVQEQQTAWVVISPAGDVPGEWLAHCLDLNIMSQGRSLAHALDMMIEAIDLVAAEDHAAGLDPRERTAPKEQWDEFAEHMRSAEMTTLADVIEELEELRLWLKATAVQETKIDESLAVFITKLGYKVTPR
jgi:predicted RNase H-like HicB family nuclease